MMPLPGVLSSIIYMIVLYGVLTDYDACRQTEVNMVHAFEGYAEYPDGNVTDKWFNQVCDDVRDDVAKLSVNGPLELPDYLPVKQHLD